MAFQLSRGDYALLLDWATQAAPKECCGLIFGEENRVLRLALTENVAADPHKHFEIDPQQLISAAKRSRTGEETVLGYFHSHPNGRASPSQTDVEMATEDGLIWLIIARNDVTAWRFYKKTGFEAVELKLYE